MLKKNWNKSRKKLEKITTNCVRVVQMVAKILIPIITIILSIIDLMSKSND